MNDRAVLRERGRWLRKLSRIHFKCTHPQAADRLKKAMSWIETEWKIAEASPDKRMFLEIQGNALSDEGALWEDLWEAAPMPHKICVISGS